jgi:hypothetical protein
MHNKGTGIMAHGFTQINTDFFFILLKRHGDNGSRIYTDKHRSIEEVQRKKSVLIREDPPAPVAQAQA